MHNKIKKALARKQTILWNNGKDEFLLVSSIHARHAHFKHHQITIDLDNCTNDEFLILQTTKPGQKCVCIKDVIVTSGMRRTFTKGVIYSEGKSGKSGKTGCWTNDQGYTACKFTPEFFNTHFVMLLDNPPPCFHLRDDGTCKSKSTTCDKCNE